jgi:NADH-quinone oxidoreductase subunit H
MLLVILKTIIKILLLILPILISVAYATLFERKVMAGTQRRRGPSVVGILGLLQPFADGLKLFLKEIFFPAKADKVLFIIAPVLFLALALINWSIMPFNVNAVVADLHLGILYVLAVSSLSVYGLILSGWASNSQYAFLGALRSAAQMISYEISLALLILPVVIFSQSLNLSVIVLAQYDVWFIFPLFPAFLMFFVSALAETSRPPFDLPEAEAELVSGYNLEYASMGFAFFFIAEYTNIIFMSFFCSILFLGGWLPPLNFFVFFLFPPIFWLALKSICIIFLFIWIRAAFPRFRYDQLMVLTWRIFLPLSVAFFLFTFGFSLTA